jgi:NAD(P)H dehydrogenase (quinone)
MSFSRIGIKEEPAMKCLIVYSHPNPKSFCHAILETVTNTLTAKKQTFAVRDLYALGFNPVLKADDFAGFQSGNIPTDIKKEQEHITAADMMIVIHPIWWTGLPAMIKGYFDRVFSYGFAYSADANGIIKLLTGKKAIVFNTQGTPQEIYEQAGRFCPITSSEQYLMSRTQSERTICQPFRKQWNHCEAC